MMLEFPIDPTDTAIGVMPAREHRGRGGLDRPVLQPALGRRDRRQPPPGHHRPGAGAQPGHRRLHRPGLRRQPERRARCPGCRRTPSVSDIPDDVDVAIVAVPAESVQDVVLDCAAKGVHGLVVISSGFAETGEEGRQRQRRLVGLSRSYGLRLIGPNCLGIINTDPAVSLNASLSPLMPPRGRAGFFCQSGALGLGDPGEGQQPRPRASRRSSAPATAPTSPATTCCSTGRRTTPPRSCCSTSSRSATRASSPGSPAGSRCASRSSRSARAAPPRACRWATRSARSRRRRRPSTRCSGRPGVIQVDTLDEMFDVAQLLAHQPLPRGRRVAIVGNSDALGLLAADAAAAVGLVVNQLGRAGRRGHRRGLRGRPRRRHRRPRRRRGGRGLHPAAQRRRRGRRQRARRGGGAVRQAAGLDLPRRRGRARAAAGPRRRRLAPPAAARCRPTPRSRRPSARSPASSSTPCGCAPPTARALDPADVDPAAAPAGWSAGRSPTHPDGVDLDRRRAHRAARGVRHRRCGRPRPVAHAAAGPGGRAASSGWDVVLKATAEHLRERPDLAHVWRNIDTAGGDARRLGDAQRAGRPSPSEAGFVVQKNAPPGVPVAIRQHRGPAVRAGRLVRHLRAADRAARRPVLPDPAARRARRRRDGPRDQGSSPMLFGYRGSEVVDVAAGRAADPAGRPAPERPAPGRARSSCSLVLAGADGATVLTAVGPGRAGRRPALGLVRRAGCPRGPGDTHPRLSARSAVTDCRACAPARTDDRDRAATPRGHRPHRLLPRGRRRRRRAPRSPGSRWSRSTSTTSRPSTATRYAAT